jgi:hypothetical protein
MKALPVPAWILPSALLLLVGAIAYLPVYLQEDRADLEVAVGKALGRPVTIDGVTLGWLVHPRPALSMLGQRPKLGGSIVSGGLDARACGATPATLIRALTGTLKAKSARLLPPAERGRKITAIELSGPDLAEARA